MNEKEHYDCGIDGDEAQPLTLGRFNRFMRRIRATHEERMDAMGKNFEVIQKELHDHIIEDKLMKARIMGGLFAIKWMVVGVPALLIFILYLMHKAGMI
jgi:hypothetical protein